MPKFTPDPKQPKTNTPEARIAALEEYIRSKVEPGDGEAAALVLCEIARQLARLANLYAFELGLEEK